ncbi:MAG: hypothetical protein ACXWT4_18655 [Methylobacter sp.]
MQQPHILFALSLFSVAGFAEELEQVFYSDRWKENYLYLVSKGQLLKTTNE